MSDNEKFYGDEDESDTGGRSDSGLHEQDSSDDTEGHMHPDEFPQGPVRRNDDSVQGDLPRS